MSRSAVTFLSPAHKIVGVSCDRSFARCDFRAGRSWPFSCPKNSGLRSNPLFILLVVTIAGAVLPASAPAVRPAYSGNLPENYRPLHKGGIDLATGLYVREDEDVIVDGDPPLIVRRTYLANYRVPKEFGIGTTHNGEIYLHGDFQNISLILAKGSRIGFVRSSPLLVYENRRGPREWLGADLRLGLFGWTLKRRDAYELTFQACGPGTTCSVIRSREPNGGIIQYLRDAQGRLRKMQAGLRWIEFEYDSANRIARLIGSDDQQVIYSYDERGRLARVRDDEGAVRWYKYTDLDQLSKIEDPGTTIENYYDANGRVFRQINRYPNDPEELTFNFSYKLNGSQVSETSSRRSDGRWSHYVFNQHRDVERETWGLELRTLVEFLYDRDPQTSATRRLTAICMDGSGMTQRYSRDITDGNPEVVKAELSNQCRVPPR